MSIWNWWPWKKKAAIKVEEPIVPAKVEAAPAAKVAKLKAEKKPKAAAQKVAKPKAEAPKAAKPKAEKKPKVEAKAKPAKKAAAKTSKTP